MTYFIITMNIAQRHQSDCKIQRVSIKEIWSDQHLRRTLEASLQFTEYQLAVNKFCERIQNMLAITKNRIKLEIENSLVCLLFGKNQRDDCQINFIKFLQGQISEIKCHHFESIKNSLQYDNWKVLELSAIFESSYLNFINQFKKQCTFLFEKELKKPYTQASSILATQSSFLETQIQKLHKNAKVQQTDIKMKEEKKEQRQQNLENNGMLDTSISRIEEKEIEERSLEESAFSDLRIEVESEQVSFEEPTQKTEDILESRQPEHHKNNKVETQVNKNKTDLQSKINEQDYVKVDCLKEIDQKQQNKFKIRVKVLKLIMFKASQDDQKYTRVKFIGGDKTGIVVCSSKYQDFILQGNLIQLQKAQLTLFFHSLELQAAQATLCNPHNFSQQFMEIKYSNSVSKIYKQKQLIYSVHTKDVRWPTTSGILIYEGMKVKKNMNLILKVLQIQNKGEYMKVKGCDQYYKVELRLYNYGKLSKDQSYLFEDLLLVVTKKGREKYVHLEGKNNKQKKISLQPLSIKMRVPDKIREITEIINGK